MNSPPASDLAQRLRGVIETLRSVIAACAGRNRAAAPTVLLLWPYLHRLAVRFDRLARRVQAGKHLVPHARPPRSTPGATDRATPGGTDRATPGGTDRATPGGTIRRGKPPRLPTGFAWLIRLAPQAAPLGSQLRVWLAEPELHALLSATPQAGKILRPLCRMLGIDRDPDLPAALFAPARPPRSCGTKPLPGPAATRPVRPGQRPLMPDAPMPDAPMPTVSARPPAPDTMTQASPIQPSPIQPWLAPRGAAPPRRRTRLWSRPALA